MARGFQWGIYVDDLGGQWRLRVDRDYLADADRGWIPADDLSLPPLPRMWRPRFVIGIDESGRQQRATAASLAAAVWIGLVPVFTFETTGQEQTLAVADIIGRFAEVRR